MKTAHHIDDDYTAYANGITWTISRYWDGKDSFYVLKRAGQFREWFELEFWGRGSGEPEWLVREKLFEPVEFDNLKEPKSIIALEMLGGAP